MKIGTLQQTHPTYDAERWRQYDALYRGGEAFRACVESFLPRNPAENPEVYTSRQKAAKYTNYVGPIVDWFAARLMSGTVTAKSDGAPDWYDAWKASVDGAGTDLVDFIRARFVDACVKGRSWWCVELPEDDGPPPVNAAEYEARGLGEVLLRTIPRESVLDWDTDRQGNLLWAIVYETEHPRLSPAAARAATLHRWTVFEIEQISVYEITIDEGKPLDPKFEITPVVRKNPLGRVPLLPLGFDGVRAVHAHSPHRRPISLSQSEIFGLWPLNRLADPQVAHFRLEASLEWSILRTCYAMPVWQGNAESGPPTMGAGYYMKIGVGESFTWTAPPVAHLASTEARVQARKDEIYRVALQMAQGVDNNAAAIGRSGQSKLADAASTDALLVVYGALVREAVQRTYEMVSAARGEELEWVVSGLDSFSPTDAGLLVTTGVQVQAMQIASPTFKRELDKRVARSLLPNVDEATRSAIESEIDANTPAEAFAQPGEGLTDEGKEPGEGEGGEEPQADTTDGAGEAEEEAPVSEPAPARAALTRAPRGPVEMTHGG